MDCGLRFLWGCFNYCHGELMVMIILFSAVAAFARLRVNDPQFRAVGVRDDAAPKNATSSQRCSILRIVLGVGGLSGDRGRVRGGGGEGIGRTRVRCR